MSQITLSELLARPDPRGTKRGHGVVEARVARAVAAVVAAGQSGVDEFDLAEPDTSTQRLFERIEPAFTAMFGGARLPLLLRMILRLMATERGSAFVRHRAKQGLIEDLRAAASDPCWMALRRHVRRVEAQARFASTMAFFELVPRGEAARSSIAAIALVARLEDEKLRGEKRARVAADAVQAVAETVYKHYLRFLFRLVFLAEGRRPQIPSEVGKLIRQIAPKLAPEDALIHADMAWIRNGVAHRHFRYDAAADALVFAMPGETSVRTVPVEALCKLALDMARLADIALGLGAFYFRRELLGRSGFTDALLKALPDILAKDVGVRERGMNSIFKTLECAFRPAEAFALATRPPKTS